MLVGPAWKLPNIKHCLPFWVAGCLLFCFGSLAQASPALRVNKNGVIYYYFSHRDCVKQSRASFTGSGKSPVIRPGFPQKTTALALGPVIEEASSHYQLPPNLIKAIIKVESNFNPEATSPKGAQGLMQLMPATAEQLGVLDSYDVRDNILGGTRYLWMLLQKFNQRLPLGLAAYNAGPQRIDRSQGIPPIAETQGFVRDVCLLFLRYQEEKSVKP